MQAEFKLDYEGRKTCEPEAVELAKRVLEARYAYFWLHSGGGNTAVNCYTVEGGFVIHPWEYWDEKPEGEWCLGRGWNDLYRWGLVHYVQHPKWDRPGIYPTPMGQKVMWLIGRTLHFGNQVGAGLSNICTSLRPPGRNFRMDKNIGERHPTLQILFDRGALYSKDPCRQIDFFLRIREIYLEICAEEEDSLLNLRWNADDMESHLRRVEQIRAKKGDEAAEEYDAHWRR